MYYRPSLSSLSTFPLLYTRSMLVRVNIHPEGALPQAPQRLKNRSNNDSALGPTEPIKASICTALAALGRVSPNCAILRPVARSEDGVCFIP